MIEIEKNRIRKYFYSGSVLSIILVAFVLSFTFTQSLNHEYNRKIEQLTTGILNEKKRFLQNAVERTIYLIETERDFARQEGQSERLNEAQIEELAIARISTHIRNLRLIDDGYIWVNRIVNYEGGDRYAIRQIHPNLPQTEGDWLSTGTTDIMGNRPYEAELEGVKKNGELYFEYYFKKMNSEEIAHKISFAKLYQPYDWIIATGVYLDDIDQLVEIESSRMKETHRKQLLISVAVATCATMLSIVILILFEKQIGSMIISHEQETERYTNKLLMEHQKTELALLEVKQLKGMLPICSYCKKIRDDKGYWNQIESYIKEHSQAEFSHSICNECAKKHFPEYNLYDEEE